MIERETGRVISFLHLLALSLLKSYLETWDLALREAQLSIQELERKAQSSTLAWP